MERENGSRRKGGRKVKGGRRKAEEQYGRSKNDRAREKNQGR